MAAKRRRPPRRRSSLLRCNGAGQLPAPCISPPSHIQTPNNKKPPRGGSRLRRWFRWEAPAARAGGPRGLDRASVLRRASPRRTPTGRPTTGWAARRSGEAAPRSRPVRHAMRRECLTRRPQCSGRSQPTWGKSILPSCSLYKERRRHAAGITSPKLLF